MQTNEWIKASLLDSRGLPTRDVTIRRAGKIAKGQNAVLHITVSPLKSHDSTKWPVRLWGIPHLIVPYPKAEWAKWHKRNYNKEIFNQWDAKVKEGFEGKDQWGRTKRWVKTSASKKGLVVWVKEKPQDVIEEESLSKTPARSGVSPSVFYNDRGEYFQARDARPPAPDILRRFAIYPCGFDVRDHHACGFTPGEHIA